MKTKIVLCAVMLLATGGCEAGWFAGGAGTGITLQRLLDQAEQDALENIKLLNDQNAQLEALIAQTQDPVEKAKLLQDLEENKARQQKWITGLETIRVAKGGLQTNWQDPAAVGGFVTLAMSLIMNLLQRKKGKALATENATLKTGVAKYMGKADPTAAGALHDELKAVRSTPTTDVTL